MPSLYIGYYLDEEIENLYKVNIAAKTKEEAYITYIDFFNDVASYSIESNYLETLPIEKFHFVDKLDNINKNVLVELVMSDYSKAFLEIDDVQDSERYKKVMSDDYVEIGLD